MGKLRALSDLAAPDAVNCTRHMQLNVGKPVLAPDGRESRILVRDTWNTDIVPQLTPAEGDLVIYKSRFSGQAARRVSVSTQRFETQCSGTT